MLALGQVSVLVYIANQQWANYQNQKTSHYGKIAHILIFSFDFFIVLIDICWDNFFSDLLEIFQMKKDSKSINRELKPILIL